jgi:hypothetical protein
VTSHAVATGRTRPTDRYVVLDDVDRIASISPRLHDDFGHWLGHVLWDHLPAAREVCAPCFDEARASGEPVESVVYYSGRVSRITAIPEGDGLAVHVTCLASLDVTSLGTLMRSLEQVEAALADRASGQRDPRGHASLQALP